MPNVDDLNPQQIDTIFNPFESLSEPLKLEANRLSKGRVAESIGQLRLCSLGKNVYISERQMKTSYTSNKKNEYNINEIEVIVGTIP